MKNIFFIAVAVTLFAFPAYAQKISVVYTGNSYASLYPCGHCPDNVGGGLTRRAALIKNLRTEKGVILVLDAGNFTAGSPLDEFKTNEKLDKKRTEYYLKTMEKMGYDFVCLGKDDFIFGLDFLKKNIKKYKLNFVSSNLKIKGIKPYLVKKIKGKKIAILGLTPDSGLNELGIAFYNYREALEKQISRLKDKVDLIMLVSNMEDEVNKDIAKSFPRIKIIVSSGYGASTSFYDLQEDVPIFKSSYQGRDLRVISLQFDNKDLVNWEFAKNDLGKDLEEEEEIKKIIPVCFSDKDCDPKGLDLAKCVNPAALNASCVILQQSSMPVTLITIPDCVFCPTKFSEDFLKQQLGGINFNRLNYKSKQARDILSKYRIDTLPIFIFPEEIGKKKAFKQLSGFLRRSGSEYVSKKELSGVFLFLEREYISNRVDVFASLYDDNLYSVLGRLRQICENYSLSLNFHPFAFKKDGVFIAKGGIPELEEIERLIVLKQLYPDKFWDYLIARTKNVRSSWWPLLFEEMQMDYRKVKDFLEKNPADSFLEEECNLSVDLGVNNGIGILIGNKMLFRILSIEGKELEDLLNYAEKEFGSPENKRELRK